MRKLQDMLDERGYKSVSSAAVTPNREEFLQRAQEGNLIPVYREILADRLTPVSAFERLVGHSPHGENGYAFLLESVEGGERIGRYSFLGIDPALVFRTKGREVTTVENGVTTYSQLAEGEDPLTLLQSLMSRYQYVETPGLPKFSGGAVGFFSYDVVRFFEYLPDSKPDELETDDCCFLFTDSLLIFDHVRHRLKVLCNAHITDDADAAYTSALRKIEDLLTVLKTPVPPAPAFHRDPALNTPKFEACFPREEYERAVERCKEYIHAGDAFQIVLSQRFKVEFQAPVFDLYRALHSVNPSPYMYYLSLGERKIVGSSPEILVTVEDEVVRVRPIAGTRWRGKTPEEDIALEAELLADEKERAEHIMLVDLGRNDIGRVCEFGTVSLDELMVIERYSHVMHIVSNVTGRLAKDKTAYDVLRASFPAGTVSGAPKVRAMQIIDELERVRRGFYAGSVGYFSYTGNMDMALAIRTMLVEGSTAYLQAGGGIVADSVPALEYQECLNKAGALRQAIQVAEEGLD